MQKLSIDAIGPIPSDELSNRHKIIIFDTRTHYRQLYQVKLTDAKSAVMALHQFYADDPVAEQILSDRGTQFVNDMVKEYNKLCGTDHLKQWLIQKKKMLLLKDLIRRLCAT